MAFADDLADQLRQKGLDIPAETIPTKDILDAGIESLQTWLASLDEDTHAMFDEVTADFPVNAGLADDTVNLAPELLPLLSAIDQMQATLSISAIVQILAETSQTIATS